MKIFTLRGSLLAAILIVPISCAGGGYGSKHHNYLPYYLLLLNRSATVSFNDTLTAVPSLIVTTSGTGNFSGTYDRTTRVLSFTLTWTGLTSSVTGAQFHHSPGATGTLEIDIPSVIGALTGSATGSVTLTAGQENDLLGSLMYVDIHTTSNPSGEIQAQLVPVMPTSTPGY